MPFNDTPQGSTHHDNDACYKCINCDSHHYLKEDVYDLMCKDCAKDPAEPLGDTEQLPSPQEKKCGHEDLKLIGAIINTHLCFECGNNLVSNEVEILNQYYEIGGFCDKKECKRYLILVV